MRVIEKEMLKAIENKTDWAKGNMGVFYDNNNTKYGARSEVYLFGNHIGDYWYDTKEFVTNIRTLIDWPSATTKSRLRALGVNLVSHRGELFIDGKKLEEYLL